MTSSKMTFEEIKITRRDIVRAEISSAIDLIVVEDFVSAHVLSFSAKAVMRGIAKAEGIETFDDVLEAKIKPEYLKLWRGALNDNYNFFKHANEDPHRELENFRPDTTVMSLLLGVVNYGLIYKQRTLPMALYMGWVLTRHPSFCLPPLSENVDKWKEVFGDPEGKPLAEALLPLRDMISLAKCHARDLLETLPAEVSGNLEV